ncbi:MAG: sulfatase-like hydrolase/transferase [Bacteroidales bacterium]
MALLVVVRGQAPRPNLLLITLDTVRADHLGSYGYKLGSTPGLDRIAREGVRFTDATANAPLTGPSHAALLTGVYPARYGVRDNATTPIPAERTTLAQILKNAGYQTGGFVGSFILDRAYGFDHGFDEFDSRFSGFITQQKMKASRTADDVLKAALPWIGQVPAGKPFFAWIHFYDAHTPYSPPAPYSATFRTHLYDGEIAYVDNAVGRLLAALERKGVLEQTLVVAIADHGESLGEHGEAEHGLFLYDGVLRIPWLVRLPGHARAGSVVSEQVRAVDLMPTVLQLLGVRTPGGLDGVSVVGPLEGRPRNNVPLSYAESFYGRFHHGWSETYSVRVGEWKFIDAPRSELYDLRTDKRETANIIDRQQGVAGRLGNDLHQIVAGLGSGAVTQARTPDRETMERLRSLGYVGFASPSGSSAGRGPDPKDKIGELESFNRLLRAAATALRQNRPDTAIVSLKQALSIDDRSYDAHLLLGDVYTQRRQYDQALGEYDAASLINPGIIDPLLAAADVFLTRGNVGAALDRIKQAESISPEAHEIPLFRGIIAEIEGRPAEALELYQKAVRANPSDPRSKARLANVAQGLGRWDVATPMFTALLDMGWQPSRSHFGLGQAAEARGDKTAAIREYKKALALEPKFAPAKAALDRLVVGR